MAFTESDKLNIAEKIISATKYLAELQASNPSVEDRKGFGTAHYGLGLILVDMWNGASSDSERFEITRGAAYLLWRHKKQSIERRVTERMLKVFLPARIEEWTSSDLDRKGKDIRSFIGKRLTWQELHNPTRLVITGVSLPWQLERAASSCNEKVITLMGNRTLKIPKEKIWKLMQFAAKEASFRGLFERKLEFDQLSLKYLSPEKNLGSTQKSQEAVKNIYFEPPVSANSVVSLREKAGVQGWAQASHQGQDGNLKQRIKGLPLIGDVLFKLFWRISKND